MFASVGKSVVVVVVGGGEAPPPEITPKSCPIEMASTPTPPTQIKIMDRKFRLGQFPTLYMKHYKYTVHCLHSCTV